MQSTSPARLTGGSAMQKIDLFLDFDGTLTHHDTLSTLAAAGLLSSSPPPPVSFADLSEAYIQDLTAHTTAYEPRAEQRKTVSQELASLNALLPVERRSIGRIESARIFQGVTAEVVRDLARQSVQNGIVTLRRGWKNLLLRREVATVSVISVNWSGRFIREVLLADIDREGQCRNQRESLSTTTENTAENTAGNTAENSAENTTATTAAAAADYNDTNRIREIVQRMPIVANEIDAASGNLSRTLPLLGHPGPLTGGRDDQVVDEEKKDEESGIWTAGHKSQILKDLIQAAVVKPTATAAAAAAAAVSDEQDADADADADAVAAVDDVGRRQRRKDLESGSPRKSVYIGDSPTDLACLMAVDVGIVIFNRSHPGRHQQSQQSQIQDEKSNLHLETYSQRALATTLSRLDGVRVRPIQEYVTTHPTLSQEVGEETKEAVQQQQHQHKTLWSAESFEEIVDSPLFNRSSPD
ncbi:MAG: hypothetical protein M1825_000260 [Sarcosagium campestre]|nr:MAG: hypothetical protein M1825_000260 [Sarcosagium campestre]